MSHVDLSPEAEVDLLGIFEYIAASNEAAAERVIDRLHEVMQRIAAHMPLMGRTCADLDRPDVRRFPVDRYVVYYAVAEQGIQVVRVLHASRDRTSVLG